MKMCHGIILAVASTVTLWTGGDGMARDRPPTPTCTQPTPFAPGLARTHWRRRRTTLFTVTQGAANHRGQDIVVGPADPQLLIAKMAYGPFDKDLKGEDVSVFLHDAPPCGPWRLLGAVRTSRDGEYGRRFGIEDDGGRVFFPLATADRRPIGWHPVRLLVHGDLTQAGFNLVVVPKGVQAVVFDIDGTLTTDDFELVVRLFDQVYSRAYRPKLRPGAVDVARAWAARGALVVYLTARSDRLRHMTLETLQDAGFPPGVLRMADEESETLPTARGAGAFKTAALRHLQAAGVTVVAAYGNASTDILAYASAGIPPAQTFILGKHAGERGTAALADFLGQARDVANGKRLTPRAPPGASW